MSDSIWGSEEEIGIRLIQSWLDKTRLELFDFGMLALRNSELVFRQVAGFTQLWLEQLSGNDNVSLFLICLRLVNFIPTKWVTNATNSGVICRANIVRAAGDIETLETAILATTTNVNEPISQELLWTILIEADVPFRYSLERVIMSLFAEMFAGEFRYQIREVLLKFEEVAKSFSTQQSTRFIITKNWNQIQRGRNEWGIYQI